MPAHPGHRPDLRGEQALMFLKRMIIEGLHRTGALGFARRLNRAKFSGATVLLYHRVLPADAPRDHYVRLMGDPTAPQLEALLRYLKRWFRFSTPAECVERWRRGQEVDPYTLLLTFDDGYADMHDQLLPVLRTCRVPATVFVTTGAVSGRPTWFQQLFAAAARTRLTALPSFDELPPLPLTTPAQRVAALEAVSSLQRRFGAFEWEQRMERLCEALGWDGLLGDERMMNWKQVEELHASGLVTIGGHTVTHPALEQCDESQARREIEESAAELRGRLGLKFMPFSYPQGGAPSAPVQVMVREAGYGCAFTGRNISNTSRTPLYQLGRQHVPPDDLAKASLLLSGLRGAAMSAPESDQPAPAEAGARGRREPVMN